MKKILLTLTVLLTMAFSLQGVAAQGVQAPTGTDPQEIEGLESYYDRTYTVDFESLMTASPEAGLDMSSAMRAVSVSGMTFDSEDSAKNYVEDMKSQIDEAMSGDQVPEGTEVEVSDDLGDIDKDGIKVSMSMSELDMYMGLYLFVDGNTVFMISAVDADIEKADALATDVAKFVADAEVQNEEVTFNEDGTSTGGVFDRMPVPGDEILGNLTSVMDSDLMNLGTGQ